ncbi:choline ABC transporter permease subunit [Aliiroseovarius crassostreae]|uniref:choline ABC transporter permease subunit n=1 Tax=Aliiroseovarius crassostreae TaxID=154981 RepID=UPI0021B044D8|nr:choline ABC transporter permease subunit [Aliiroseovarius crassostreae]UWQ04819.1 choline ABC transporter permease subunit [Aliiroseovarius crassostreae]
MEWLEDHKVPIGKVAKFLVDWLTSNMAWFFDGMSEVIGAMVGATLWLLQWPHPFVLIGLVAAMAWYLHRSLVLTGFTAFGLLLIINQGYWIETTETLSLVLAATTMSMMIGVPLGILSADRPWLYRILQPLLDLMQTIPTFVYLIPALVLFGLGAVPALVATIVFTVPASIRLTYLGISSTPHTLIETADAFGATKMAVLWKVKLPWAKPQILAGLTQTIMLSLSMVVIAALVGASGLGVPTLRALNQVNIAKGFEVGIAIVIIAIILDRMLKLERN